MIPDVATELEGLRRLRPYREYKHSGVDFLGAMPATWKLRRLKYCVRAMTSGGTPDSGNEAYWSEDEFAAAWVAIGDMTTGPIVTETEKRLTPAGVASKNLRMLPAGTLLYSMYASLGKVATLGIPAVINQAILGIVPNERLVERDFLRSWLLYMEKHLQQFSSTNTQENLNATKVRGMPVFIPSTKEQRAIAAFLDLETGRIDALIAKKEQLIEVLEEKSTTFIAQAVTKGLNPNTRLRDSGVKWLGEIPAHWQIKRTKFAARLRSGHTPSRQHQEYWENCTVPWFGLSDVWQIRDDRKEYVEETSEKISELGLAHSAARLLPKDTVILSRTASVGYSAIMGVDMATTQDFVNWVCGPSLRPEYLLYVFRSMRQEFTRLTMGSTHQTIYMPDVGQFSTPVPPLAEQDAIVAYIRSQVARIDSLVDTIVDGIERLSELRVALISAAVTGKIDVRQEAA